MNAKFDEKLNEFLQDQVDAENVRQESLHHLHEMQIMSNYLIDEKHAEKLAAYDWGADLESSDSYTGESKTLAKLSRHITVKEEIY